MPTDPTLVNALVSIVSATLATIPPSLLAYAALQQGRANGTKADHLVTKAEVIDTKATGIIVQTDKIHDLTNGTNLALTRQLAAALERIDVLEKMALTLRPHDQRVADKPV